MRATFAVHTRHAWSVAPSYIVSLSFVEPFFLDPKNVTDGLGFDEQGDDSYKPPAAEILASLLEKGVLDVDKATIRRTVSAGEDSNSWGGAKTKKPRIKPPKPAVSTGAVASPHGIASTESSVKPRSPRTNADDKPSVCAGCKDDVYANRKSPSRSLLSERSDGNDEPVTSFVWPVGQGTVDLEFRKSFAKGDKPSAAESQEDSGSGDPHIKVPSSQATRASSSETGWNLRDLMDLATSAPSQTAWSDAVLSPATEKAISPDSAEIDHLLQVPRETSVQPPSPSGTETGRDHLHPSQKEVSFEAGKSQGPFTILENDSRQPAAQGAQGGTDVTVVTEKSQVDTLSTGAPTTSPPKPSEPPSDLTDIDYRDPSDLDEHLGYPPGGDSTKGFHDKLSPWHKHLHYDDFSPFDYLYPTPPFYADGYGEGGMEDDDDDDEDLEDAEDDDIAAKDVRNFPKVATPKIHTATIDERPTSRQDFPFRGETYPKSQPDVNKDQTQTMSGAGENGTECRNGYVRRNNSCKSLCEIYPTYCYNGGQCYIVENIGAFCR